MLASVSDVGDRKERPVPTSVDAVDFGRTALAAAVALLKLRAMRRTDDRGKGHARFNSFGLARAALPRHELEQLLESANGERQRDQVA